MQSCGWLFDFEAVAYMQHHIKPLAGLCAKFWILF